MRLLASLFLCFAFWITSIGQTIVQGPPLMPVVSSCATTDTTIDHDELLEGFQTDTTGFENANWSLIGGTTNQITIGDTTSMSSGKVDGMCNQAFKVVVPADGAETYARWDIGAGSVIDLDTEITDIVFFLYVETAPDDTETYFVFSFGTVDPASVAVRVTLAGTAGNPTIAVNGSTATAFTTGAWHKVSLHLDITTTGFASNFQVDDATNRVFNRTGVDGRYVYLGPSMNLDANDSGTVWLDLICINTP